VIEIKPSLRTVLKRLKLSGILAVLPERVAYARKAKLAELDFLELVLQDEIDRREQTNLAARIARAGCEREHTLEAFDWDAPVTFDRDRVRAACRAGKHVLALRADAMLKTIHQSRADNSTEKVMRGLLAPHLLVIDDFGLRKLDDRQSSDLYEIIIERHRRASTIITSNRSVEEWIPLFADPILAQSAIDRFAHNAHHVVIEGDSYRPRKGPQNRRPEPEPKGRSRAVKR